MGMQRWHQFCYMKLLVLFCFHGVVLSKITCTPGLSMPGYTVPHGDIVIEYGNPLDITCVVVNATYSNASLSFKRNSETIPSDMIDVVNSTAIKLHIDKPGVASGDTYTCLLKNETNVCMNRVTVGIKPQAVTDFKCISYNNENLTCTWTAPENYIRTDYNLTFSLGDSRSARYNYKYGCPLITMDVNNRMSCFWNVSTTPAYRPVHEIYNFTLAMKNKFGKNQTNEVINHFAHVLSGPPENLTVINRTSSSIYLYWEVPLSMQTFPPGVHHRVLYQYEFGEKEWHNGGMLTVAAPKRFAYFNLTNLKYAHALCDIRVSLRSAKALPDDESMWSRNASATVRTSSKIPDVPPATNVGSFETVAFGNRLQYREAYIYWKQIPEVQKNGPDFKYSISVQGDEYLRPIEITNAYAKFKDLSISRSYTFNIWSRNAEGLSTRKSTVFVPKQTERVKEPVSFTKVEFSEGEFELTWEAPDEPVTNYTIFTCLDKRDRPYQCEGMLNWTIVPSTTTNFSITVDKNKIFQFAIAANTHNSSSGMIWASCTVIHNKNMGKLKNVWINRVGATFIEMGWKLDCSDRIGSVEGYIVYFCPIRSPMHTECKAPQANSTFIGTMVQGGNITGLNPYTTYMLTVSVITKHTTFSQQSDPLFNTTLEAAPSPPQDLSISSVTNSTITISWNPPAARNGLLRYYDVKCIHGRMDCHSGKSEGTSYTFTNLTSYENYSLSVAACSVTCSEKVNVTTPTKMGHASQIPKPTVDGRNDTSISIIWSRPAQPGGKNDYYIVRLKQKYKNENITHDYNTTALTYVIDNCSDGGKYNTFYVSVKAVNKFDDKIYEGPWSDELENYCEPHFNYIMYFLLIVVVAALAAIGFLFTRLYHRCKIMRDVEVKLPPGLAPVVTDHTLMPWSTEKHQESRITHSPGPDEEMLLEKMSEGIHCSGDSSGCSSGHESVTLSLESGTHLSSSSDSGTEQTKDHKIDTSYDDQSESSPYVMTGETIKTINPGYIPFDHTEPIEKSSGYVVAGLKNVNGYIPFNQTETVNIIM